MLKVTEPGWREPLRVLLAHRWGRRAHPWGPGRASISRRLFLGPCSGLSPKIAPRGVTGQLRPTVLGQRQGSACDSAGWLASLPCTAPGPRPAPVQRPRLPAPGWPM